MMESGPAGIGCGVWTANLAFLPVICHIGGQAPLSSFGNYMVGALPRRNHYTWTRRVLL